MLLFGQQRRRTCQGVTRRAFLEIGASSVLGLSLADLLRWRSQGVTAERPRAVIMLWLWGGPSQLDTWDPKPNAPAEYRGPFTPIATRVPGIRITELFPQLAELTDQFSILRALHTTTNDHGVAGTIGLTGSASGGVNLGGQMLTGSARPAAGAIVARLSPRRSPMPPYMVIGGRLHQGKRAIIGEGSGPLGAQYEPFRLDYDAELGVRMPALQLAPGLTPERLVDRRHLLEALESAQRQTDTLSGSRTLDGHRLQAFNMLSAPGALRMFDLSQERPQTLDRYGRTRFGQSCVLARRLVEHGIPFVQVNWSDHVEPEEDAGDGGWDNHYRNFQIMQDRQAPWLDQGMSALLTDLRERGLLSSTLVVAMGEFGRTPRINEKAGRDHWEHCYSALLAGGGLHGGRVIGESDAKAERPHHRPTTPADVAATIYQALGFTSEQLASLGIGFGGQAIEELL